MKSLAIILTVLLLIGCSSEKRLQRLLRNNPELSRRDTITVVDTVIIPGDTIFKQVLLRGVTDATIVENERQVVSIARIPTGSPCDTVPVAAEVTGIVKPDAVIVANEVVVDRVVPCPPGVMVKVWWRTAAMVEAVMLALLLFFFTRPQR